MKISQKIGLIGVGNMGTAILGGLFKKCVANPTQVRIYDKIPMKSLAFSKRFRVGRAHSIAQILCETQIVILAVKPQNLSELSAEFKQFIRRDHLVISILAGTPIAKLKRLIGTSPKIVRAMPNLPAKVGEGITALASADKAALRVASRIFSGCGQTVSLREKDFDLVTAISGSGPAYFFHLMELLADFGCRNGLSSKNARMLAVQTAVGAGLLAHNSEFSPAELRVLVTSKHGTTEAALKVLKNKKFRNIFQQALHAASRRSRQLSQA